MRRRGKRAGEGEREGAGAQGGSPYGGAPFAAAAGVAPLRGSSAGAFPRKEPDGNPLGTRSPLLKESLGDGEAVGGTSGDGRHRRGRPSPEVPPAASRGGSGGGTSPRKSRGATKKGGARTGGATEGSGEPPNGAKRREGTRSAAGERQRAERAPPTPFGGSGAKRSDREKGKRKRNNE